MILVKEVVVVGILYYWLLCVCTADRIRVKQCRTGKAAVRSEVHEVSIKPCPGGGVCELYKGSNATITVKFTPWELPADSSSCKISAKLVWVSKIEMDFGEISPNACDYIDCPLAVNEENVFNATFHVSKFWPTGPYPLKLRVQERSGRRIFICQVFKVILTDRPAEVQMN